MDKIGAPLFESVKKLKEDLSLLHTSYKLVGMANSPMMLKTFLKTKVVIETAIN